MRSHKALRAIGALLLCSFGFLLARSHPYQEHLYLVSAGGCNLETSQLEPASGATRGAVVLFHGLAANKKLMSYLAQGFVAQGLKVFTPDLPGHGRTSGRFSPARAEQCASSLVLELMARGLITPQQTILAGHSMGGAIAIRLAARIPNAGVIAISPAPMKPNSEAQPEMLLYTNPPALPKNSLIIAGGLELKSMREAAADLQASRNDGTTKLSILPWATHVSLLFDPRTARASQEWAARILHLEGTPAPPSSRGLLGALAGFLGLLLITAPFLRELCGNTKSPRPPESVSLINAWRSLTELTAASLLAVVILHFVNPLHALRLFEGDYLAGFLLLVGASLLLINARAVKAARPTKAAPILAAAFAALILLLLITAWFDLTFSQAWLTAARWARFPAVLLALLPYHFAEELFVGPLAQRSAAPRLGLALSFRLAMWLVLLFAIFYLHSGEVLLALLAPSLALFNLLQRAGSDCVRGVTGSPTAAALFGAILQAGFCLVIFPVT